MGTPPSQTQQRLSELPARGLTSEAGRAPATSSVGAVAFLSLSPPPPPPQTRPVLLNPHRLGPQEPSRHYSEPQGLSSTARTPKPSQLATSPLFLCHQPVALCLGLSQSTRLIPSSTGIHLRLLRAYSPTRTPTGTGPLSAKTHHPLQEPAGLTPGPRTRPQALTAAGSPDLGPACPL